MEWNPAWENPLTSYVKHFNGLMGDRRTRKTCGEIVKGIIGAGSLICQRIASQSAELSKGKKGSQRVIRLATGQSKQCSELDAEHLIKRLREVAVEQLEQAPEDEVWLMQVRVLGVDWDPWLLFTDWPVTNAPSAVRIFSMYRQHWSVEDSFKFLKTCLGWETCKCSI